MSNGLARLVIMQAQANARLNEAARLYAIAVIRKAQISSRAKSH